MQQVFFDLAQKLLGLLTLTVSNLFVGSIPMDLFLLDFLFFVIKLAVGNIFLFLAIPKFDLWMDFLLLLAPCPDPAEEVPGEMRHCSWNKGGPSRLCSWEEWTGKEEKN